MPVSPEIACLSLESHIVSLSVKPDCIEILAYCGPLQNEVTILAALVLLRLDGLNRCLEPLVSFLGSIMSKVITPEHDDIPRFIGL